MIILVQNTVDHLAGVIHTDDGILRHSSIVTTTIGIDNGTTDNFQIGLS